MRPAFEVLALPWSQLASTQLLNQVPIVLFWMGLWLFWTKAPAKPHYLDLNHGHVREALCDPLES